MGMLGRLHARLGFVVGLDGNVLMAVNKHEVQQILQKEGLFIFYKIQNAVQTNKKGNEAYLFYRESP